MNLLILAGFGCGTIVVLWIAQTLSLLAIGTRPCLLLPYRHDGESSLVRWSMKLALHAGLLSMILLYPWVIGFNPWQYHLERIVPLDWRHALAGLGLTASLLSVPLIVSLAVGWVRFENRYRSSKLIYKLVRSFLIPIPLTLVEEPLFRGVVQEQFLAALPAGPSGWALAVVLSSLIFATVHFVKPQKRSLLPFIGLFGLGVILSLAYIRTNHHYLLPITIHGTGVWFVQMTRSTTRYGGPAWLVGHASYPICGAMGLTAMTAMGIIIMSGYESDAAAQSPALARQGMFGHRPAEHEVAAAVPGPGVASVPRRLPEGFDKQTAPLNPGKNSGDILPAKFVLEVTGAEAGYRSITGHLGQTNGQWFIHYGNSAAADSFGGKLALSIGQDVSDYQPGDLVSVHGELIPANGLLSAFYQVRRIKLLERK